MATSRRKLDIKCTQTDCESGLHCFIPTRQMQAQNREGACSGCGAVAVDWPRLHQRSLTDVAHTFASMRKEWIRNFFWQVPLNQRVLNQARRKGKVALRVSVYRNLESTIGPAKPWRDGAQTEMPEPDDAVSVYPYARHATATCCRKCLKIWHGIPLGRELTEDELQYCTELVCRYVEQRVSDLTADGERIPPLREK